MQIILVGALLGLVGALGIVHAASKDIRGPMPRLNKRRPTDTKVRKSK